MQEISQTSLVQFGQMIWEGKINKWKVNDDTPLQALLFSLIKATVKLRIIQQFLSKY